jgi:hypothetical protein
MSQRKRICDNCGKEKDVEGGRTCENGHFICKDCVWAGVGFLGFGSDLKYCRCVRSLSGDSRRRRKCVNRQVLFLSPHFVVRGVRKGGQRRLNEINKFQRQVRNVRVRDGGVQNG